MSKTTTKLTKVNELYRADVLAKADRIYLYLFQRCYNKDFCFPSINYLLRHKTIQKHYQTRHFGFGKSGIYCEGQEVW